MTGALSGAIPVGSALSAGYMLHVMFGGGDFLLVFMLLFTFTAGTALGAFVGAIFPPGSFTGQVVIALLTFAAFNLGLSHAIRFHYPGQKPALIIVAVLSNMVLFALIWRNIMFVSLASVATEKNEL